ncbi:MAG: acyl-CoA dehydratase activase-related protein [Halanaerobiaceae bacterium]
MRKITFPHMGFMDIPLKAFFQELGFSVVTPPRITRKTLDLGMKNGPEFACLPLKINLGNFIQALDKGANIIVMGGGCGPCRFGYYGEVQRAILKKLGYDFKMFVIEPGIFRNYRRIKEVFGKIPYKKIYPAAKLAWIKGRVVDRAYRLVLKNRAREEKSGQVDNIYRDFLRNVDNTASVDKINNYTDEFEKNIKEICSSFKKDIELNVGIVGEIYLVLEPFVNLEVERKLGKLGVSVEKDIYMTSWLLHFLHLSSEIDEIKEAAANYLRSFVGGHGLETVGNAVRYARRGFDGVIQLAPFTCMPEIISQSILPAVSKKEKIPVLTLFFDEHSADAGLQTRLEAFVDLLVRKKTGKGETVYGK